ncbi:MAG TPA: ATP-binding cassette domain-containing protein [Bacteroidales bacterium]|nr:ATP-binding cassette domain-containing protein [Bacteroidales bacterium]HSA44405.1 ATP-binding cassette domain-containing protein [Bacteroidales bacterium]
MDIIVDHFTKDYGNQRAVDDISFRVVTGEILGFLGPNGAGKTTTMKAITTFLKPTAGNIRVGSHSILDEPEEVKKHIGYLPENNPLYTDLSVIDYLGFIARLHDIPQERVRERILEMVVTCGLEGEKHKKIGELSKGYRQRVGLAQALIHDPQVLVLDEPTSGLDPNQIIEIRDLIRRIGKEKTVLLSSHILAEVEATCDRILIINKGRIVADGTADELRRQSQGSEIVNITIEDGMADEIFQALRELESVEIVSFLEGIAGGFEVQSKPELSSRREIFKLCCNRGWTLTRMTPFAASLEDVFREVTR